MGLQLYGVELMASEKINTRTRPNSEKINHAPAQTVKKETPDKPKQQKRPDKKKKTLLPALVCGLSVYGCTVCGFSWVYWVDVFRA